MVADIAHDGVESVGPFGNRPIERFAADFGGSYVAEVDEFFLVAHIVVERRIGEAQNPGDVLER